MKLNQTMKQTNKNHSNKTPTTGGWSTISRNFKNIFFTITKKKKVELYRHAFSEVLFTLLLLFSLELDTRCPLCLTDTHLRGTGEVFSSHVKGFLPMHCLLTVSHAVFLLHSSIWNYVKKRTFSLMIFEGIKAKRNTRNEFSLNIGSLYTSTLSREKKH